MFDLSWEDVQVYRVTLGSQIQVSQVDADKMFLNWFSIVNFGLELQNWAWLIFGTDMWTARILGTLFLGEGETHSFCIFNDKLLDLERLLVEL